MLNDKKRAVTAILGPDSENVGVRPEGGPSDLEHACTELVAAIENKDPAAMASAFRACVASCEAEYESGE